MKPAAQAAFVAFNAPLEGVLAWMYLDILGYVTTGMGNLVDPVQQALTLPWKRPAGSLASADEVAAAWQAVDACRTAPKGQRQSGLATQYGGAFEHVTEIRLDHDGINACVAHQIAANEIFMRKYFPAFDALPADAQLCLHSMAWAMGPGFAATFQKFRDEINAGQYAAAEPDAVFRGSGVQRRIDQDKLLLGNAQAVVDHDLSPDALWWPADLSDPVQMQRALDAGKGVA